MTASQEDIDFKPIKMRFPQSVSNGDGPPIVISRLKGVAEKNERMGDTLTLQIELDDRSGELNVSLGVYHVPFLILTSDQLNRINARVQVAKSLLDDWLMTPTGRAFSCSRN